MSNDKILCNFITQTIWKEHILVRIKFQQLFVRIIHKKHIFNS